MSRMQVEPLAFFLTYSGEGFFHNLSLFNTVLCKQKQWLTNVKNQR